MGKIDVEITKARIMNGTPVNVGDEIKMDAGYFERAGFRFAKKIESKEVTVDEKPKKSKKKKNEDKELVAETK